MESNSSEKKPKRPRIGQTFHAPVDGDQPRYERPSAYSTSKENNEGAEQQEGGYRQPRPYQPRPYQPRSNNGYNRQGGYNNGGSYNRPYQPRPQRTDYNNNPAEGENAEGENNTGYRRQPRPYQPRQNGGYNNNGGQPRPYQPRQNGGYNNNGGQQRPYQPRQNGGYNNGGGQQRPYQQRNNNNGGGYNNNRGGQQRPYQQRPNGGFKKHQQGQQGGAFPGRGKSFTPRPKRIEYEVPVLDPNEQIRLNKYMSNAGICSRREADEYIQQGLVKVNGQVVTELGTKITPKDVVEYDEKVVTPESKCYILLNKPKDCVTTSDDPNGRLTVMDLVKGACQERIYPVGRLDRNTTGVLLLTNDGDLASKLTHPKFVKKKIYHVWCDRDIAEDDMQHIADGIELEDGPIHADAISYATETDRNQAGIEIHSGRNRIVRRIFESLGYHVTKLDRVYFAGLTKKNLPRGRWRYLTQEEVNYLKMGSFE